MNFGENKKYVKIALTGIAISAGFCVILFTFYRFDSLQSLFNKIYAILRPFLYGAVLSYLLTPMCGKLEAILTRAFGEKGAKAAKQLSIVISILVAIVVVGLLCLIIIPEFVRSVVSVANALPGQLRALNEEIDNFLVNSPDLQEQWESFSKQILNAIEIWRTRDILPVAQTILSGTASYVTSLLTFIKDLLLGTVISIYLLATRKQFAAQCKLLLRSLFQDLWVDRIEGEVHYMDRMFYGFISGKLLDSLIVGILCFIGCLIMGFASPVLISVIIGVTNIIPFFGPFIGAIPCALLLLLDNPVHCLMFVIFILVLQQLDGNVIGPKVLGNTTGLSGLWVTFAILMFGGIWGITGMIIGVPLFAVIYDVIRRLCYRSLKHKGRGGMIQDYQSVFHPKRAEKQPPKKEK